MKAAARVYLQRDPKILFSSPEAMQDKIGRMQKLQTQ